MPSIQSRIFRFILKHRKKRTAFDFNTSIPRFREECEKAASLLAKLPDGIEVKPITIDGLRAEWILPAGAGKEKVILYTHGGGYASGSCQDHRSIVARLVKGCNVGALLFEYRLAPEHPYPAAVDDSVAVYHWLLAQGIKPSNIIMVGESAGGGLGLAMMLALREQGVPLPVAAAVISPWTDLKCSGESYRTKNKVSLAPANSWTVFSKYYVGDNDPCLPLISPLYGDLRGLPPILIHAGEDDELIDDSTSFAEKARTAGVDVTLRVGERMVHCYPLLPAFIPEARQAMEEICAYIKTNLG